MVASLYTAPTIGTTVTVASGNLTLVEPASSASGDLLVACIAARGNAAFTLPAGWTICGTQQTSGNTIVNHVGGTSIASGLMAYIIRGGSAPSYAFTRTGGDLGHGKVVRYPGPFAASPLDQASATTAGSSALTTTGTGITTVYGNDLLVGMLAHARNTTNSAFFAATDPIEPSGTLSTSAVPNFDNWTERFDTGTSTGADGGLAIYDAAKLWPGATGNFNVTHALTGQNVLIVAAFKSAIVDSTELQVPKVTGYAVVDTLPKGPQASKVTGYVVLGAPNELDVSRIRGYAPLSPANVLYITRLRTYAILGASVTEMRVARLRGYAVLMAPAVVPGLRRRVILTIN